MARVSNSICDGCGKILLGKDRTASVSEDYICVKGSISLQLKENELNYNKRSYMFLTEDYTDERFFCDVKCFQSFIETQRTVIENRLKQAAIKRVSEQDN